MKDPAYFNDIAYALEKTLYYERGRGAYFRATMIGVDFIKDKNVMGQALAPLTVCIGIFLSNTKNCSKRISESGWYITIYKKWSHQKYQKLKIRHILT